MGISKLISALVVCFLNVNASEIELSKIDGIVPVDCQKGVPAYPSNEKVKLFVYGINLKYDFLVGIAKSNMCESVQPVVLKEEKFSEGSLATVSFTTPYTGESYFVNVGFYLCLLPSDNKWVYQNINGEPAFYVYEPVMTPLVYFILIVIAFSLSCLMSGLNIGLLSLDMNELQMLKNTGTSKERKYAEKIIPVRKRGNYLLCSIVITSTMCNAIATVIIERFIIGWFAIAISTCLIVLIGEIIPQSVCTYAPLAIGAYTVYITIAVMVLTAPASFPLALLLNFVLGKDIVKIYSKERLKEQLKMTDLATTEEKIIFGTLEFGKKTVEDVMTMLDGIFKLPIDAVLDLDTITLIAASGYSRIPIYVRDNSNICFVLITKELALIDPDDKIPLKNYLQNSIRTCLYMPKGCTLDAAFATFMGSRVHMAFIVDRKMSNDSEHHVIGLITYEDVIEEILQQEINDETDIFLDNHHKQKLTEFQGKIKISSVMRHHYNKNVTPSENVKLATFYFLSGLNAFSPKLISPEMLKALLNLEVFYEAPGKQLPQDNLYVKGKSVNYFIMVIEGLMEIKYGRQELKFEAGPFKYFGTKALELRANTLFTPDYALTAITKSVYLKITQDLYEVAIMSTRYLIYNEAPDIDKSSTKFSIFEKMVTFE